MSFVLVRPSVRSRVEYWAKPASTAFAIGDVVANNDDATDNTFDAMAATSTRILGVVQKTIASTDSDYADETRIPLLIDEDGIWEVEVDNGTADANDEGGYIDVDDSAPDDAVDVAASTEDHFHVTRFVDGTTVQGRIVTWTQLPPAALG